MGGYVAKAVRQPVMQRAEPTMSANLEDRRPGALPLQLKDERSSPQWSNDERTNLNALPPPAGDVQAQRSSIKGIAALRLVADMTPPGASVVQLMHDNEANVDYNVGYVNGLDREGAYNLLRRINAGIVTGVTDPEAQALSALIGVLEAAHIAALPGEGEEEDGGPEDVEEKEEESAPNLSQTTASDAQPFEYETRTKKEPATKAGADKKGKGNKETGMSEKKAGDHVFNDPFIVIAGALPKELSDPDGPNSQTIEFYRQRLQNLSQTWDRTYRAEELRSYAGRAATVDANSTSFGLIAFQLRQLLNTWEIDAHRRALGLIDAIFGPAICDPEALAEVASKGHAKEIEEAKEFLARHRQVAREAVDQLYAQRNLTRDRTEATPVEAIKVLLAKGVRDNGFDTASLDDETIVAISDIHKRDVGVKKADPKKAAASTEPEQPSEGTGTKNAEAENGQSPKEGTSSSSNTSAPQPKAALRVAAEELGLDIKELIKQLNAAAAKIPADKKKATGRGQVTAGPVVQAFGGGLHLLQVGGGHFHLLLPVGNGANDLIDVDVPSDGSCLLHSVAWHDALTAWWTTRLGQLGADPDVEALRGEVVTQMRLLNANADQNMFLLRGQIAAHFRQNMDRFRGEIARTIGHVVQNELLTYPEAVGATDWDFEGVPETMQYALRVAVHANLEQLRQVDDLPAYIRDHMANLIELYVLMVQTERGMWGGPPEIIALQELRVPQQVRVHVPGNIANARHVITMDEVTPRDEGKGQKKSEKSQKKAGKKAKTSAQPADNQPSEEFAFPKDKYAKAPGYAVDESIARGVFDAHGWRNGNGNDNVIEFQPFLELPVELHASLVKKPDPKLKSGPTSALTHVEFVMRTNKKVGAVTDEEARATSVRWWYDIVRRTEGRGVGLAFSGNVGANKEQAKDRQAHSDEYERAYVRFTKADSDRSGSYYDMANNAVTAIIRALEQALSAADSQAPEASDTQGKEDPKKKKGK